MTLSAEIKKYIVLENIFFYDRLYLLSIIRKFILNEVQDGTSY